jgi:hypothetical protein
VDKQLTEKELRQQAVRAITESLGPVEALRFLALISREPFDYQEWRREYFSQYDLDKLLSEVRKQRNRNAPDRRLNTCRSGSVEVSLPSLNCIKRFERSEAVEGLQRLERARSIRFLTGLY